MPTQLSWLLAAFALGFAVLVLLGVSLGSLGAIKALALAIILLVLAFVLP